MFDTRALRDACGCVSVGFERGSTGFNNAEPQTSQGAAFISSRCFQGCSARLVYDFMIKMARLQPHTHARYLQLPSGHTLPDSNTTPVDIRDNRSHNYPLCIESNRMCCLTIIVSLRACEPLKSAGPDKNTSRTVHSQNFS